MAIFSERLLIERALSGDGAVYTVPPGKRVVVRQLTAYGAPVLSTTIAFFRDVATGAVLWFGSAGIAQGQWTGFDGRLVFDSGDAFQFHVATAATDVMDCSAHGYVFDT